MSPHVPDGFRMGRCGSMLDGRRALDEVTLIDEHTRFASGQLEGSRLHEADT